MYEFHGRFTATLGQLPAGDAGTKATLSMMRQLAEDGAKHFTVRMAALRALRMAGSPEHDPAAQLAALHRYVRDEVLFVGDIAGVETLQAPHYTLHIGAGDCDDRAVLLAAMARSIGIPADLRFRVIAANPRRPAAFSHVYVVARVAGREIPLDPTFHSNPAGWEHPHPFRRAESPA